MRMFQPMPMGVLLLLGAANCACGDAQPLRRAPEPPTTDSEAHELVPTTPQQPTAPATPIAPPSDEAPEAAVVPLVLVHGFSGFSSLGPAAYFYGVAEHLRELGFVVYTPTLPPVATSPVRAVVLREYLRTLVHDRGHERMHLIAHSQGGLDVRALVNDNSADAFDIDRVASITTISTPHRGTAVADLADAAPPGMLNPAGELLAWAILGLNAPPDEQQLNSDAAPSDLWSPDLANVISFLTTSNATAFSQSHPWPVQVPVFSVAGVSNLVSPATDACSDGLRPLTNGLDLVDPLFFAAGSYLSLTDGGTLFSPTPNDGLITVPSARDANFLGCIPADHPDEIGQFVDNPPNLSGFSHLAFYADLASFLRTVE